MTQNGEGAVPYGAWPSPITAARLVEGAAVVDEIRSDGADIWWSELRPKEGGRTQLVRRSADGEHDELFAAWDPDSPQGAWNARTAVMEYGGGAWSVRDGVVVFSNWADQRLYRVASGEPPVPITPEPSTRRGLRWSEPTWVDDSWLICVRESHEPDVIASHGEPMNELIALPADGSAVGDPGRVHVLDTGADFVHAPAVSDDEVAWLRWSHPDMPWDSTELVTARLVRGDDGAVVGIGEARVVAGGAGESIVQPGFVGDGELVFCSDRGGWWNPWIVPRGGGAAEARPIIPDGVEAEIGGPMWVGGLRWWAPLDAGRLLCRVTRDGADRLATIDAEGKLVERDTTFTEIGQVVPGNDGSALVVAASATTELAPYRVRPGDDAEVTVEQLAPARDLGIGAPWISVPRHISFGSAGGRTAHALHYRPTNPDVAGAPDGDLPPLVVMIHGGPTSSARGRLDLAKQFWTSRGFTVVDVNYGGSTGYGRPYRELLDGQWGVVDVEDAVAAAEHLATTNEADPSRLAIRGGSAGGFTTLAALCFHDTFAAGASHYGVADLGALAAETHKFESRYLDGIVGPWPEARAVYEARSPIFNTARLDAPLIVLQGSEDEVVPPNQAEMMVAALAEKGVPHAYVLFEGEQHGFRRSESIIAALEAELWFYGKVFGFTPADDLPDVEGAVGFE